MFLERLKDFNKHIEGCDYTTNTGAIDHKTALSEAVDLLHKTRDRGGIVYVVGNGGSAGIASHFHTDLLKGLQIPSQTLYDPNLVTCLSNDYGYEHVFSSPLNLMITPRDMLVAISSSGKSVNIINAATIAKDKGAFVFTLSGFQKDNPLRTLGHLNCYLNCFEYGLVEMGHFFLLHTIIDHIQQSRCKTKSNL